MIYKLIHTVMIAIVLLLFGACSDKAKGKTLNESSNNTEKIVEITYQHYGGMQGLLKTLTITEGITLYSYSMYIDKNGAKRADEPTLPETWNNLMDDLDLATFEKIESGPSRLPIDGTDQRFTITTASGKAYTFINGSEDKHYQQLKPFFDHVIEILYQLDKLSKL